MTFDLSEWRDRMGFTQDEAATMLGFSARTWRTYERGYRDHPMPKYLEYACRHLESQKSKKRTLIPMRRKKHKKDI